MYSKTKIYCLMENNSIGRGLKSEHGLCLYVETRKHRLLVDTGASDAFLYNAKRMQVNIKDVDTVFLSHGHYDHAGGIMAFAEENSEAKVYISKKADGEYYHGERYIGIDKDITKLANVVKVEGSLKIDDELEIFSGVTGRRCFPNGNKILSVKQGDELIEDDFSHEQYLVIHDTDGDILISGCAHNGVLNILDRYREIFNRDPKMIISGFHMMKAGEYTDEERNTIIKTAEELRKTDIFLYTGHCTGDAAIEIMKPILCEQLNLFHAGDAVLGSKPKLRMRKGIRIALIAAFIIGVPIAVIYVMLYFATEGNPISRLIDKQAAKGYIETYYPGKSLKVDSTDYDFKVGDYVTTVVDTKNQDGSFMIYSDGKGNIMRDDYNERVLSGWNVYRRLDNQYRKMTDAIFEAEEFPYSENIAFGEIAKQNEMFSFEDSMYVDFGFVPGADYDIYELAKDYGHLVLYVEEEHPTIDKCVEVLENIKKMMDEKGIPFKCIYLVVETPVSENGSRFEEDIYLNDFPYELIGSSDFKENVIKWADETRQYFEEMEKEREEEFAGSEGDVH